MKASEESRPRTLGREILHAESGGEAATGRTKGDGGRVGQRQGNPSGKGSYPSGCSPLKRSGRCYKGCLQGADTLCVTSLQRR